MNLTPAECQIFSAVADLLIPAGQGMPSASQAGVAEAGLAAVLQARPELEGILRGALRAGHGQAASDFLQHLKASDTGAFAALAEAAASAYFMNPEVRSRLAYHGQKPLLIDESETIDPGLLKPVLDRGRIYRSTASGIAPPVT